MLILRCDTEEDVRLLTEYNNGGNIEFKFRSKYNLPFYTYQNGWQTMRPDGTWYCQEVR